MSRITSARVIVSCPGRNFVTLKIETADGVHGVGDATLNGRELAVASYLVVVWSLRRRLKGRRVDIERLDVLDLYAADVRFLQATRHGEVLSAEGIL